MGLLRFTHRRTVQDATPTDHPVVGQYRQLLAAESAERLLAVHRDAAALLDPFVRLVICNTARSVLGADDPAQGQEDELVGDATAVLPELVVTAATPDASAFLAALDDGSRHRLAQAVTQMVTPAVTQANDPAATRQAGPPVTQVATPADPAARPSA